MASVNDLSLLADQSQPPQTPAKGEIKRRIYRACVHCRQRKSKCDLDSIDPPGKPPCKRCVRENRECILAGSRRGGRRERKPKLETGTSGNGSPADLAGPSNMLGDTWPAAWSRESSTSESPEPSEHRKSSAAVDNNIASKDIQNPSDALEILAQVAGDVHVDSSSSSTHQLEGQGQLGSATATVHSEMQALGEFPPLTKGILTFETMQRLLAAYRDNYHPFFPICPQEMFDASKLTSNIQHSPHLFCAVLTIASADNAMDAVINKACHEHLRHLLSNVMYGIGANLQAVEALLILAEWAVRNQSDSVKPGKGREDSSTWMLSGMAIRLGYLLGLERTAFRNDVSEERLHDLHRRRLVWSACYMSDRQASIRVGRGFWSRGPGPLSGFTPGDFPTLGPAGPGGDDYAFIFKANLELTQIFGNVHDVLYSNRGREMKLLLAGDYVKYIDDFRAAIRSWQSVYGALSCSARIKISLLLSFDYLRLYVNAFAFQAAMARMVAGQSETFTSKNLGLDPDVRFIYDSVDAAKCILTTVNNFVDPVAVLPFLPLKYFLYIVHAAVFLYKAMSTDTMGVEEKDTVQRMVVETVLRLQKAASSSTPGHLCGVYARLISLLWRRPAKAMLRTAKTSKAGPTTNPSPLNPDTLLQPGTDQMATNIAPPGFSWLDLESAAHFATQNGSQGSQGFSPYPYQDLNYMPAGAPSDIGIPQEGVNMNVQQWFNDGSPTLMF